MLTIPHHPNGVWEAGAVDLRERLDGYEVTAVPVSVPHLTVVWSEAGGDEVEGEPMATHGVLALLDDYRITRVPGRAAS
jgi:hypothetical protein